MRHYKLINKIPIEIDDFTKFYDGDRVVRQEKIENYYISTVFLGFDHSFLQEGTPILFETMVFNKVDEEWDQYQERYSTWEQAEDGHKLVCEKINNKLTHTEK
jgi:hypothetical protein